MIYEYALGRPCAAPFDHEAIYASMHELRHFLYRETAQWDVPEHGGFEFDQFDTPRARYLVGLDGTGTVRAQSRLIRCNNPFMLSELWPNLIQPARVPDDASEAEGSRTGVDTRMAPVDQMRWYGKILLAHVEWGLTHGVDRISFVTYPGMVERSLIPAGLPVTLYGPKERFADGEFVAGWFPCTQEAAETLMRIHQIKEPVLISLPSHSDEEVSHVA